MRAAQAVIADLAASGLSPDQLALVIELSAAVAAEARPVIDQAAENKRAYDREYQRKRRTNRTTSYDTNDVVSDRVSPDKETPQTPKKITPSHVCEGTRARLGYHRLPEGWQPTKPYPAPLQAKVDEWPPGTLADEVAAFKRWAANAADQNGKGRKLDWDKALWNWLGRKHDEQHGKVSRIGSERPSSWGSARSAVMGAVGSG